MIINSNQVEIVISAGYGQGKTSLALSIFNLLKDVGFKNLKIEDLDCENPNIGFKNDERLKSLIEKDLKVVIKTVQKSLI